MKKSGIILLVILLIALLLGAGLQIFLTKGLATVLNQHVFPAVKERYGLEMSVTNVAVNLFRGSADLDGLVVRNLKGYEEPELLTLDRCRFDLEMRSLFKRDPIVIRLAEATGARLVVERNKEKNINVKQLFDALKRETGEEKPQEPQESEPAKKPMKPIPIHLRRFAVDTTVTYVDSGRSNYYALNLRLTGSDIFTIPAEGQSDSLLVLRGSVMDDKNSFVTDLNAMVSPLTDPKNASFRLSGSILDIDASFLDDLLKKNKLESRSFSVKPSVISKQGVLDGSQIELVLHDLILYGKPVGDTPVKLPIKGTLQNPSMDLTGALQSLFSDQAVKIGKSIGLKELRKQLSGKTDAATTNETLGEVAGEALSEKLGGNVKELENNEAVKDSLKNLGTKLLGK